MPAAVRDSIEHELRLIAELKFEPFFLTVHDVVHYARSQGILCQGRGSAANSAVCYCLQITEVDPSRMAMLFERFISKERNEPPDIDVDFEHERREEVIQYIYRKIRPRARGTRRHRHLLPAAQRSARCRQGLGPRSRAGRPAGAQHAMVGWAAHRSGAHPRLGIRSGRPADRAPHGALGARSWAFPGIFRSMWAVSSSPAAAWMNSCRSRMRRCPIAR